MKTYKQKKNPKKRNTIKIYGSGNTFGKTKKPDNPISPLEHRVSTETHNTLLIPPAKPPKPTPLEIKLETSLKNYIDILLQLEDLNSENTYFNDRIKYRNIPFSLKKFDYEVDIFNALEQKENRIDWEKNTSDENKTSISYRTPIEQNLRIIDIIILDLIFFYKLENKYLNFLIKHFKYKLLNYAAYRNNIDIIKWAKQKNIGFRFRDNSNVTKIAVANNFIELLKFVIRKGALCSSGVSRSILIKYPHLLEYYLKKDCKCDEKLSAIAAERGDMYNLKIIHSNGCPWNKYTCEEAAKGGHLECLKYAHENGCPWDDKTCEGAAKNGHLECLKYAHENGCPWNSKTCATASANGHIECLKYANENGCVWNASTTGYAALNGQFECLKYAHENGCPWDELTCAFAARGDHLVCLKYAHENGCPWTAQTILYAINKMNLECLMYAVQNGCPFYKIDNIIPILDNNLQIINKSKLINNNIEKAKKLKQIINYLNINKKLFSKFPNPDKADEIIINRWLINEN